MMQMKILHIGKYSSVVKLACMTKTQAFIQSVDGFNVCSDIFNTGRGGNLL